MKEVFELWDEVSPPAETEAELRWHEAIWTAFYADDVSPHERNSGERFYDLHLQFVRWEASIPANGVNWHTTNEIQKRSVHTYIKTATDLPQ